LPKRSAAGLHQGNTPATEAGCTARALSESANHELVPVGAIETQHIHYRFSAGGINELADPQKRIPARHSQQIGSARIGGSGVDFLVGVAELDLVISFEDLEQRLTTKRRDSRSPARKVPPKRGADARV
jgi:hypothetical protein